MPDVSNYSNEDDWMADCVPTRIEEGDDQDRAVAACMSIWQGRNKSAFGAEMKSWLDEWSDCAVKI